MAHPKRVKSTSGGVKKQVAANQSLKRKQKSSSKFKNEQLREALDKQTHELYNMRIPSEPTPQVSTQALQDLEATLRGL